MNLFKKYENWRVLSALKKHPITYSRWKITRHLPCIKYLSPVEKARLRILTCVFLEQKNIVGVQGLTLTNMMKLIIASQACIPVLKLGINYYSGFLQVSIYPGAFWVNNKIRDASGVLHTQTQLLAGQSWSHGPVILSWEDILNDMQAKEQGHNVIIHEFAHKIDMLNQGANGVPPIHKDMNMQQWGKVFRNAFHRTNNDIKKHRRPQISRYSATSPAEFFAVVSEYFFSTPEHLQKNYTKVYNKLKLFYKQDPVARITKNRTNF